MSEPLFDGDDEHDDDDTDGACVAVGIFFSIDIVLDVTVDSDGVGQLNIDTVVSVTLS